MKEFWLSLKEAEGQITRGERAAFSGEANEH